MRSGPGAKTWATGPARLVAELSELEAESDFVLVDAGSGLGPESLMLAAAADQAVIVSTPEPTSLADAHAAIGRFQRLADPPRLRVLVNQAASAAEAAEVLDRSSPRAGSSWARSSHRWGPGSIRADPHVPLAVRGRRPFVTAYPGAVASRGVRRLARASGRAMRQPRGPRAALPARSWLSLRRGLRSGERLTAMRADRRQEVRSRLMVATACECQARR